MWQQGKLRALKSRAEIGAWQHNLVSPITTLTWLGAAWANVGKVVMGGTLEPASRCHNSFLSRVVSAEEGL